MARRSSKYPEGGQCCAPTMTQPTVDIDAAVRYRVEQEKLSEIRKVGVDELKRIAQDGVDERYRLDAARTLATFSIY